MIHSYLRLFSWGASIFCKKCINKLAITNGNRLKKF